MRCRWIGDEHAAVTVICEMETRQRMRAAYLEMGYVTRAILQGQYPTSEGLADGREVDVREINGLSGVRTGPRDFARILFRRSTPGFACR